MPLKCLNQRQNQGLVGRLPLALRTYLTFWTFPSSISARGGSRLTWHFGHSHLPFLPGVDQDLPDILDIPIFNFCQGWIQTYLTFWTPTSSISARGGSRLTWHFGTSLSSISARGGSRLTWHFGHPYLQFLPGVDPGLPDILDTPIFPLVFLPGVDPDTADGRPCYTYHTAAAGRTVHTRYNNHHVRPVMEIEILNMLYKVYSEYKDF